MFASLFSIISFILSGYIAKRLKIIEQKQALSLIDFVIYFAIPALIFEKIYHLEMSLTLLYLVFIGMIGTAIGVAVVTLVGWWLKFSRPTLVTMVMMASFGNTLFLGIPVLEGFLGEEALREGIFYDQFATAIPVALLGPFILALASKEKASVIQSASKIVRFPPVIALVAAFLLKSVPIPEFIFSTLKMFGSTVTPVALFAIGLQMVFSSIRTEWKPTLVVLSGKMILSPLCATLIILALGIPMDESAHIAILQSAMPPMVLASAMVMKAQLNTSLAVSTVAFGVGASLGIMPLLYSLLSFL